MNAKKVKKLRNFIRQLGLKASDAKMQYANAGKMPTADGKMVDVMLPMTFKHNGDRRVYRDMKSGRIPAPDFVQRVGV
jgi:hypothetical protein